MTLQDCEAKRPTLVNHDNFAEWLTHEKQITSICIDPSEAV